MPMTRPSLLSRALALPLAGLLLVAYGVVVVPLGLLGRMMGGDPMRRTPDKEASTYWRRPGKETDR
jgi:hypothetical protein